MRAHTEQVVERRAGHETVRAGHDTTTVAFDSEGERKGLGPLNGKRTQGFLAHATLAVANVRSSSRSGFSALLGGT